MEIVCQIDEKHNVSKQPLLEGDWSGVASGKEFEKKYREISARKPGSNLKGREWGECLAAYAHKNPLRPDNHKERYVLRQIRMALYARNADYDYQKESLCFDRDDFQVIERSDHQ